MTLVVTGGRLLSATSPRGEARDIVIEGDTIVDLVAPGSVHDEHAERLDAARRLIIPGLINSHTHSHGGLSKGIGDRWSGVSPDANRSDQVVSCCLSDGPR